MLCFEVEDTGIGIPPEQLQHIFTAFHQVESKWTMRTEGIGLGLTVSQRLMRMMGGELRVRSTPGVGSVFWFELPLPHVIDDWRLPIADHESNTSNRQSLIINQQCEAPHLVPPSQGELTLLLNLANDGDIMAIQERVKVLETLGSEYAAFTAQLAALAKTFQIGRIHQFLRQYIDIESQAT